MTEAERKAYIAQRQKDSLFWQVIHFFGSLNLAMFLLITIAIACGVATFMESGFNTRVAQHYIYKAPWFMVWLIVLCVNLACAALTRYPWLPKHRSFVITHMGIITLLLGAMVGQKKGFEASVTLQKDENPKTRLVLNHTMLQIRPDGGMDSFLLPINLEVSRPTAEKPRKVKIPLSKSVLLIDRYAEQLAEDSVPVAGSGAEAVPAVGLRFASGMMGQEKPVSLFMDPDSEEHVHFDFFGLAEIEFVKDLKENFHANETGPAKAHETQIVFAAKGGAPVIVPHHGPATGAFLFLIPAERDKYQVLVRLPDGAEITKELGAVLGKAFEEKGYRIEIKQFWRNFTMKGDKPEEGAADGPGNPAIMAMVEGPAPAGRAKPMMRVALAGGGKIAYEFSRGGKVYNSGEAVSGDVIKTGWADWAVTVGAALPAAVRKMEYREEHATGSGPANPPGILVRLATPEGQTSEPQWILSGRSQRLVVGSSETEVGFGLETRPIPFSVKLLNFEVPRDEGTETPANFISTLEFADLYTNEKQGGVSRMNHPASYPGGFFRQLTGINYKFSQAGWNPDNLNETTLQVLYDPGWSLNWIGSLMICAGIALMFYFKPRSSSKKTT